MRNIVLDKDSIILFQEKIWQFYAVNKRNFVWRNTDNPYNIVISEVMLQQTQTHRVEQKYNQFIAVYSNFKELANASLKDVLYVWQGLGYNRRAQFLYKLAKKVVNEFEDNLPSSPEILVTFPGIGKTTAASICAFAFNIPTVFIETNIRAVFLYEFFQNKKEVHDQEILPLVEQTLDRINPREWYYALMDYGVMLKRLYDNPSRKSAHYTMQSPFQGSDRQIRSKIIKILLKNKHISFSQLSSIIRCENEKLRKLVQQLCKEKLLKKDGVWYQIA
jgi:A/G-specific adenine glycosylase